MYASVFVKTNQNHQNRFKLNYFWTIYHSHSHTTKSFLVSALTIETWWFSLQGTVLFDCHAEIVSRRGLRKFFFEQLITLSKYVWCFNLLKTWFALFFRDRGGQSIFESHPNGGYCLKKEISFHLYINTSPCGDARIFSPHESSGELID